MNKKILSILLTLVLITASSSMVYASAPTDVIGTAVEPAVERLGDLGVLLGYPDGTFRPNEMITRAEYAAVATRVMGFSALAASSVGPTNFGDVVAGGWSSGYINVSEQKDIIKGMGIIGGVNTFGPSLNITYEQAVTIIVRALGYEGSAQIKGGYPDGHLLVAAEEGLLQGVSGTKGVTVTRAFVAQLTYNALEVPMMIKVSGNDVQSGTQGTDPVHLFNDLHLINAAAASGNWVSVDETIFASAGITGVTSANLGAIQAKLQLLASGSNQNWSPSQLQAVFDLVLIELLPNIVTFINGTNTGFSVDGVVYTVSANTTLKDINGNIISIGDVTGLVEGDIVDIVGNTISITESVVDEAAAVEALINLYTGSGTQTQVTQARLAYDGLNSYGKAIVDAAPIDNTAKLILGEDTLASGDFSLLVGNFTLPNALQGEVLQARNAYDALSPAAQLMVPGDFATLQIEEAKLVSVIVDLELAALPLEAAVTLADKADIIAARASYNTLTPAQAAQLTLANVTKLNNAEGAISDLEAALINVDAAEIALTTLLLSGIGNNLIATPIPAGNVSYSLGLGTLPTLTTGNAVLALGTITITKDSSVAFTFEVTVTIIADQVGLTAVDETTVTKDKVFIITVPYTVAPITVQAQ